MSWGSPWGGLQSRSGVLVKSWGHHAAIALGIALGGSAKSLADLGQLLGAFLDECLGDSVGTSFKVLGGFWPNPGRLLRRLPCGVLGAVSQSH